MTDKGVFMNQLKNMFSKDGMKTFASALFCAMIGIGVGGIILLLFSAFDADTDLSSSVDGLKLVLFGVFCKGRDSVGELVFGFNPVVMGNLLFHAMPLIMTGLSVTVAFRGGLFNIGVPGQYLAGTAASLVLALKLPTDIIPATVAWLIAFLGGMAAGALWGAIPGMLKAYLNVNEVLAGIMLNWIAANGVTWIFENSSFRNIYEPGKAGFIMKTSSNSVATAKLYLDTLFPESQVNAGIFVAVFFAFAIYVIFYKTVPGYELRACGGNMAAADYAGMKSKKIIIAAMAFGGAVSGAGAALYYLSGNTEFFWSTYQFLPSEGLNGIPVALLAGNNPVVVILSALFISSLSIAGQQLKNLTSYNESVVDIIIGIIVYLNAFPLLIKGLLFKCGRPSERKVAGADVNEKTDENILFSARAQSEEGEM